MPDMIAEPEDSRAPRAQGLGAPESAPDTEREVEELTFLVGNACSRTINLLMQPRAERDALREELEFLASKASRLATLLR
jgi:hypothetical protein